MNLTDKKVAILGAGQSGLSAAHLVVAKGGLPHIFDAGSKERPEWPSHIPLTLKATEEHGRAFKADLVVLSPGIETESDFVKAFHAHGVPLIGEIELAYHFFNGTIIAITGTNGKTTSTELIEKILQNAGKTAIACGNYGLPLADVVLMEPQPEFVSLELSSFQLETIKDFHPKVAIWLNFAPDHMDRYTTLDEYFQAKCRIFENQTEQDIAILRCGEDMMPPTPQAQTYYFSAVEDSGHLSYKNNAIYEGDTELISLIDTKMNIKHNAENVMVALLATRAVGISLNAVKETLTSFAPPEHRCELVRILDDVEFINDSKATNIHALEAAVRSQTKPITLIAGGKDKGLDYTPLLPLLKEKVQNVIVFGQIADQLADTFSSIVPVHQVSTLKETVLTAQRISPRGSVVLFSPGTSSFDMFSGYEERGRAFKTIVLDLN